MPVDARLELGQLTPAKELEHFIAGRVDDGAVVSFVGLARNADSSGAPVDTLELQWHPVMTQRSLDAIAAEALSRFGVSDVVVVHRGGRVTPGDPIVFVACAAPRRREAFLAADCLMDRLKTEAMFWKREIGPGGERWIEPSPRDLADAARWSD